MEQDEPSRPCDTAMKPFGPLSRCLRGWFYSVCSPRSASCRLNTAVPQPFPRPGSAPPSQPARPAPRATSAGARLHRRSSRPPRRANRSDSRRPGFPGAQFIASYDAGRNQRYYIFGSAAPFVDLVTSYRTVLKQKGELVYDVPATHEFDVGKYREETMAFPPGVTIKDFQSDISQGYPNPKPGGQPARFPTVIQIVPVTER